MKTNDYSILSEYLELNGHISIAPPPEDLRLQALIAEGDIPSLNGYLYGTFMDGTIMTGVIESNNDYVVIETWCNVDSSKVMHSTTLKDSKNVPLFLGQTVTVTDSERVHRTATVGLSRGQYILTDTETGTVVPLNDTMTLDSDLFPSI